MKYLFRFIHLFTGCTKSKCEKVGALSVRCKICGQITSLSDYY